MWGASQQLCAASCAFYKREKHHLHRHLFSFSDKIYFGTEVCAPLHHTCLPQRLEVASSVCGCSCSRRRPSLQRTQRWAGVRPWGASCWRAQGPIINKSVSPAGGRCPGPHPSPRGLQEPLHSRGLPDRGAPWQFGGPWDSKQDSENLGGSTSCRAVPSAAAQWGRVSSETVGFDGNIVTGLRGFSTRPPESLGSQA